MLVAFLSGWLLAITVFAQPPKAVNRLEPGTAVERQLARGHEHLYQLNLAKGDYVNVLVEQRNIDVIVQTRRPDGRTIADFQDEQRRQGQEDVELVAEMDGVYTLSVKRAPG